MSFNWRLAALPDVVGMPEFRSWDCDEEFESALRAGTQLMDQARRQFPERAAKELDIPI